MAALGWLELGNADEALAELERIEPELQSEPAAQAARLECLMAGKQWDEAAPLAELLCEQCPEEVHFYLHFAYAARRRTGGSLKEIGGAHVGTPVTSEALMPATA